MFGRVRAKARAILKTRAEVESEQGREVVRATQKAFADEMRALRDVLSETKTRASDAAD